MKFKIFIILALLLFSIPAFSAGLKVEVNDDIYGAGDTFSVDVWINDLPTSEPGVGAFQFQLSFDSTAFYADSGVIYGADGAEEGIALTGRIPTHNYVEDDGDTLGNIDMPDNVTGDYYFATATLPDMDMYPDENLPYGLYTGNVTADSVKLATFYFSFNTPQPLGTFDFNLIVDSTSAKATRICDIEGTKIEVDIEDDQVSIGGLQITSMPQGYDPANFDEMTVKLRSDQSGPSEYSWTYTPDATGIENFRTPVGNYYVISDHFNHLAVITENTVSLNTTAEVSLDFTDSGLAVLGTDPMISEGGLMKLRGGDANGDDAYINSFDFLILRQNYQVYPIVDNSANFNGDEYINSFDFLILRQNYQKNGYVPSPGNRNPGNRNNEEGFDTTKDLIAKSRNFDAPSVSRKSIPSRGENDNWRNLFGAKRKINRQDEDFLMYFKPSEGALYPGENLVVEIWIKEQNGGTYDVWGLDSEFYVNASIFDTINVTNDPYGDSWDVGTVTTNESTGQVLYSGSNLFASAFQFTDSTMIYEVTLHVKDDATGSDSWDFAQHNIVLETAGYVTDTNTGNYTIPAPMIALSDTTISHTMQPNMDEDNAASFTISNTYNGPGTADLHFDITATVIGGDRSSSSQSRKVDQIPVNARVISTSRNSTSASRTQVADSKSKAIAGNERGISSESYRDESRRVRGKKASARETREQVCEQWLCWDPDTGQIPKQNDQVVQLSFDTNGLGNGTYQIRLDIASNSGSPYTTPLDSIVDVMVTLNVEAPELVVNPEVLDEFSLYTDDDPPVDSMNLWIKNSDNATGELDVSTIAPMTGAEFYTNFDAGTFPTLAIGDSSMIKVYFSTTTAGTYTDTLEIVSNDPLSPHKVPLSGSLQCTPDFALSPDELNKTFEAYNDTDTETLTIINNQETDSGCDLIVNALHVNADNPNPPVAFSGVTFPITIAPQASQDVMVEFYGEDVGTWDGAIYVELGGSISTMDSVGLMVTVTEYSTVDIDPPVDDQEFLIYESSIVDLDNHIVTDADHNADAVTWTANIVTSTRGNKNSSSDFASRSARQMGSNARDMKLRDRAKGRATQEFGDSELSVIIDDETHEITFANIGDWYGTKQVKIRAEGPKYDNNSDDYDEQTITVTVNAPDVNLPETSHSFTCFIDQDSTWMMTVENISDGTLDGNLMIENVTISGSSEFTLGTYTGDPIAPGGSLDIPVIFNEGQDGPEGGPYTATLTIETNDPDEPSLDVTLTGNMECRPAISVSPTEVEANLEMMVIPSVVKYVDITNIADCEIDAPLEITDITLDVLTDTEVTVEYIAASRAELPYTLSNGETLQVKMTFHAAAVADIDDTLKVYSNDTDDPMVPVPVHYQVTPYEEIVLNLPDPFAFNEDQTGTINLDDYVDMDPDHTPDEVMWMVSESVDDLFVEINDSREAIFTSSPHWYGFGNSVTFTGEGPGGEEVSQTIDVNVLPVNDAPSFTAGVDTTWLVGLVNDYSYTHTFMAKDIDGDALTFTYSGDGADINGFTATETSEVIGDTIHYTVELEVDPQASDVGVHTLTVTMSDVATRATVSEDITIDVRQSLMPDLVITESWGNFIIGYSGANSVVFNIEEIQSGVLRDITFEATEFTTYDGQTIDNFTFDPSSVDSLSALYESSGLHEMDITMNFTLPEDIGDFTNFYDGIIKVMGYGMGADGDPNTYYEFELEDVEIVIYPEEMEYEYEAFDFSGDNYVTSIDVLYFSHHYDTEPGDEYWDPICDYAFYEDIDGDGLDDLIFGQDNYVGFADLVYLSMYYGQGGGSVLAVNPPSQSRSMEQTGILSAGFGNGQISELDNTLILDILAESREIRAGEIAISYNPERAEFLTASEGNLMKNGGNSTFFNYKNDPENGILKISVSGLGSDYSVSNNGILATVQFKVNGNSDVAISHIKAIDSRVRAARTEKGESYEISSDETGVTATVPATYGLIQNYPNPFNPETTIEYQLPERANVTLSVYNSSGQLVKTLVDEEQDAGYRSVVWDGTDRHNQSVPSGLYIYIMDAGEFHQKRQMMLLK